TSSGRTSPTRLRAPRRPPSKSSKSGRARACREVEGNDMTIGLGHYLTVAAILFTIGIFGIFLNRKNVIIILMSIELILLAGNINLVAFSAFLCDLVGQIYALLVLTVAAAEAAIGLAILVAYYRNRGSIAVEDINLMRGAACITRSFSCRSSALSSRRSSRSPARAPVTPAGRRMSARRITRTVRSRRAIRARRRLRTGRTPLS